jgi:GNAT superfamily N-acetyltransferase
MTLRPARASDFLHLETFVWQAIFPAFDLPGLSVDQRAENDALVEGARHQVDTALTDPDTAVFVAIDAGNKGLIGYIIADATPRAYAEIPFIVVKRVHWGKGVAAELMAAATNFIGRDRAVSVAVRYYNQRALAFFAKHDFADTGETSGDHAIPRTLLLREAYEVTMLPTFATTSEANATTIMENEKEDVWENFPTGADEPVPVFEALPDYRLKTDDDVPLFTTGTNALATEVLDDSIAGETTLNDDQLSELEAFIARARAKKGTPAPPTDERPLFSSITPKPNSPKSESSASRTASAAKRSAVDEKSGTPATQAASNPPFDRTKISFEIDYGDGRPMEVPAAAPTVRSSVKSAADTTTPASFEFAFDAVPTTALAEPPPAPVTSPGSAAVVAPTTRLTTAPLSPPSATTPSPATTKRTTKQCPDCATTLPVAARFCFSCGYPQPETEAVPVSDPAATIPGPAPEPEADPSEDFLTLADLTEDIVESTPPEALAQPTEDNLSNKSSTSQPEKLAAQGNTSGPAEKPGGERTKTRSSPPARHYTLGELKRAFREHLHDRVTAYFGARKVAAYHEQLEAATGFQQLRDGILSNLLGWLNEADRQTSEQDQRLRDTLADLTEYFIVETAATLSNKVLPQRLLRHQSVDWATVDLFRLVMDYLDFDKEREVIYTDFVTMPARALRNATKSFLRAGKDERIFFICDQSLVSQAKNGFAITDSGIYWKNVLQPAGVAMFNEIDSLCLKDGYLDLGGQFFNGGGSLNLKIALLLDKLRRMGVG